MMILFFVLTCKYEITFEVVGLCEIAVLLMPAFALAMTFETSAVSSVGGRKEISMSEISVSLQGFFFFHFFYSLIWFTLPTAVCNTDRDFSIFWQPHFFCFMTVWIFMMLHCKPNISKHISLPCVGWNKLVLFVSLQTYHRNSRHLCHRDGKEEEENCNHLAFSL